MKTSLKITGGLLAFALLFTISGCTARGGSFNPDVGPAAMLPDVPASEATAPATEPVRNERGLVVKGLGEKAGLGYSLDNLDVSFTIDSVTVDPSCYEYGSKPESGRTLLLNVRVATTASLEAAEELSFVLYAGGFSEVGTDGVTHPAQSGMCTDFSSLLPSTFGANQQYVGTIEIVVPEASGIITLGDGYGGGWEWAY